jgi:SAM-dependent methyltransferase
MTHSARDHGAQHVHQDGYRRDIDGQAEILDLDEEVLAEHLASITAWLPVETSPRQIVDLGCGTSAGTFALLTRFPGRVHDRRRLLGRPPAPPAEKACEGGVADRVRTVQADLDAAWPDLGKPELVWASASMHHMADPDHTPRQIHDALAPGGLFAVVELAGFPRFLPGDAPEDGPGLEERCHAAGDRYHAEHVPHRGADWGPRQPDRSLQRGRHTFGAKRGTLPGPNARLRDDQRGSRAIGRRTA